MKRLYTAQHWVATLLGVVLLAGVIAPVVRSACTFAHDAVPKSAAVEQVASEHASSTHAASSTDASHDGTTAHCTASKSTSDAATSALRATSSSSSHECHGTCLVQCCSAESTSSAIASAYLPTIQTDWVSLLAPVLQRTAAVFSPEPGPPVPDPADESPLFSSVRLHVWTATFLK